MKKHEAKKKKRIGLSGKLLLISVAILIGILTLFNLFGLFDFSKLSGIRQYWIFIIGSIAIVIIIVVFIIIVYYVILKRIEEMNEAVQKVAQGDYSVTVSDKGGDELSMLATNFNKMTKELQVNAMLSKDFVGYVSHEFKTPLSVIRTHAEALSFTDDPEERKAYTDVIIGETDGLNELSKNIILLCRLDSTNLIAQSDFFSPAEQIRSFVLSTQLQWSEKGINIDLNLEDFEIMSNSVLVFHIWQNLIGNAIKFTEENGNIKVDLHKNENELSFSVADDGPGIAPDEQDKLFKLFYMGNKSRNKEGSGIGLYLTQVIVKKLGGKITFESEFGKGSTFYVSLPL